MAVQLHGLFTVHSVGHCKNSGFTSTTCETALSNGSKHVATTSTFPVEFGVKFIDCGGIYDAKSVMGVP